MVGVLRDAKPKRGARIRGRTGSCTIRQGVVKGRGREVEGAERAYLLVVFYFILFYFIFLFKSLLCLKVQKTHAALAMEIKNL